MTLPHPARHCTLCGAELAGEAARCPRCSLGASPTLAGNANPLEEDRADPLLGVVVGGRYRLLSLLGRGGMGVVYRAEHAHIGKVMALKLLAGDVTRNPMQLARFRREAMMASQLSHPNTVQVFDFGTADGLTYLAMEYLRGRDLGEVVALGPLAFVRVAKLMVQVCSSLAEAHEKGIVHRDLKPENIFLVATGEDEPLVKVLDFGLAKLRDGPELGEVTQRGSIVGTPYYMAPEQIRGDRVDARTDIYALGAVMYTCLTGRPPFDGGAPLAILTDHLHRAPDPPSSRAPTGRIPPDFEAIVLRALAKSPTERFGSVTELQSALVRELEQLGQSSQRLLDSGQLRHLANDEDAAAIRAEVERYERRLRGRGRAGWLVAAGLGLMAVVWVLVATLRAPQSSFEGLEREPNDQASDGNPIPFGVEVRGFVGRRLDPDRSDRDFYQVEVPTGTDRVSLQTTALPNFATCTFLYRAGLAYPVGRYCTGSPSLDLEIPMLVVTPGRYLLAVMQDREGYGGAAPPPVFENVSDPYRLRLAPASAGRGVESEPNDTPEDGAVLQPGASIRGRLGWMRDVDYVCSGPGPRRFVVVDADAPPRPRTAVLAVRRLEDTKSGELVQIHRREAVLAGVDGAVAGRWVSPVLSGERVCLMLTLLLNQHAGSPLPPAPPASAHEYEVQVDAP